MFTHSAIRRPIVQGAGHIALLNGKRCAIYEDNDGKLYATADLIPIAEYMRSYHQSAFIHQNTGMLYHLTKP